MQSAKPAATPFNYQQTKFPALKTYAPPLT
jgi:hypothetical protein